MSGYRDSSNYDPYASPRYGRPLRPYNWVQWIGVGLILVGIALDLAFFAGRLGWIPKADVPVVALPLILLGASFVNSRRERSADPAPKLAAARRKWLAITVAVCAVILGIATIFALKGY